MLVFFLHEAISLTCKLFVCWEISSEICRVLGGRSGRPSLVRKSPDGCHLELVWYTASACAIGHQFGDNCKVHVPEIGNDF